MSERTTIALAVIRVSKKKQATDERYSLPAQEKAIRDYCARERIELLDLYAEPGTSAFTADITKIPGLNLALHRIEAGEANALIVHESSRLARTERLTNEIADRLEACGGEFINVSMGGFDYSTPEGRMVLSQEAAMNTYWSRKTGQHSRKGKREQFEQGLHIGKVPFGYTHAVIEVDGLRTPTRRLPMAIVPEEAAAIRRAFEEFPLGKNAHAIARELNESGFKPRSTKGLEYFQPQTVRDMLRNRLYAGWVQHLGEWRPGRHEAIVSEASFWAAQTKPMTVVRRKHPPRPLRGIAKCPEGHRLYVLAVRHSPKEPYRKHYYYREPSTDYERPCSQAGKIWNASDVDEQLEKTLRTLGIESPWLRYVEEEARCGGGRNALQERQRIEAKLLRLQDEYIEGRIPKERWNRIFEACQVELAKLAVSEEPLTVTAQRVTSWWDLWANASAEAKNETCRLLFESVVLDFEAHELILVPHSEFAPLFDARLAYVGQDPPAQGSRLCGY